MSEPIPLQMVAYYDGDQVSFDYGTIKIVLRGSTHLLAAEFFELPMGQAITLTPRQIDVVRHYAYDQLDPEYAIDNR